MFRQHNSKINYVGASDSKFEGLDGSFKKQVHLPATLFNRSPYKDRQNKPNAANTPIKRLQNKQTLTSQSSKKLSVSPIRHSRQPSYLVQPAKSDSNNTSSSKQLMRKPRSNDSQFGCKNHGNKPAKYIIEIDDETLPYCQKCAILLASQGFKVDRLGGEGPPEPSDIQDYSQPRQNQINVFLDQLNNVMGLLQIKKSQIQQAILKSNQLCDQQLALVSAFYAKIVELVNSHRQALEKAVRDEKEKAQKEAQTSLGILIQAISDTSNMKQDILTSLDQIKQADQKVFRPVMESYKDNVKKFKSITLSISIPQVNVKKVGLPDINNVKKAIVQCLQMNLHSEHSNPGSAKNTQPQISNIEQAGSLSSVNFSFQAKMAAALGQQYGSGLFERLNQDIGESQDFSQENFMKSSMKNNTRGLFADFHE